MEIRLELQLRRSFIKIIRQCLQIMQTEHTLPVKNVKFHHCICGVNILWLMFPCLVLLCKRVWAANTDVQQHQSQTVPREAEWVAKTTRIQPQIATFHHPHESLQVWDGRRGVWVVMNLRWSTWILQTIHQRAAVTRQRKGTATAWLNTGLSGVTIQPTLMRGSARVLNAPAWSQLGYMWSELFNTATSR